jgi:hypothetical protein
MLETLKSITFVIVTLMVALILQAQAGKILPENYSVGSDEPATYEQLQVYN